MSSPAIIDCESLLAPIAGANPAGVPLLFDFELRKTLNDKRAEIRFFAEVVHPADWAGIVHLAQESLVHSSKDLVLAARLTEALVKQHGFGGVRDGLRLLRRLVEECWDRVHPVVEDGNLEVRAGAFNWLDDEIRGARFPYTLRTIPLARAGDGQSYGWQQWRDAQVARGPVSREEFEQAAIATPREFYQTALEDIAESIGELTALTKALREKLGKEAPELSQLRQALIDCQALTEIIRCWAAPAVPHERQHEPKC
jgi:type VI secretion system protein ImpA